MTISTRLLSTGTLLVNGQFDEYTFQKGSALFDGSTNYLSTVANDAAYVTGANNFTIEAWIYPTTTNIERGISNTWQTGGSWVYKILNTNFLQFIFTNVSGGGVTFTVTSSGTITANTWTHVAMTRYNNTITHYINGIADPTTGNVTGQTMYGFGRPFRLGVSADLGSKFPGYISNFRFVNGSAVYTGNFTPPRAPLLAVANTTALYNTVYNLANVNAFTDNSVSKAVVINNSNVASTNFIPPFAATTITANTVLANQFDEVTINAGNVAKRNFANGTTQISGIFDEFTGAPVVDGSLQLWLDAGQTSSYPGSGTTWTDLSGNGNNGTLTAGPVFSSTTGGGTFTFDGSTQYASTTLNSGTVSDGTLSAWCYPIASPNAANYDGIIDGDSPGNYGTGIGINNGTYQAILNDQFWTTIGQNVTLNQWVMVSMTFTATTAIFYLNGVQAASLTYTRGTVSPGNNYLIGKSAANARYFNGKISNAMVYNRALSADEISTNFNALRGRYGI